MSEKKKNPNRKKSKQNKPKPKMEIIVKTQTAEQNMIHYDVFFCKHASYRQKSKSSVPETELSEQFIHLLYCLFQWVMGKLVQSTGEKQGTPWTGCQSIAGQHRDIQDKQPHTPSFTPKSNLERPINLLCFGLWEEARGPGENPHMHGENMQRSRTQNLLAARQQCYQLRHHAVFRTIQALLSAKTLHLNYCC
ncbi:hypothetical protein GOODEAATRI_008685 [Goodea atripinnis]|uniref:Uncharacterized protein n=1 Tax=Goodea atripinnis TaxID=208336 RepID=A0ABV0MR09_9TELE